MSCIVVISNTISSNVSQINRHLILILSLEIKLAQKFDQIGVMDRLYVQKLTKL